MHNTIKGVEWSGNLCVLFGACVVVVPVFIFAVGGIKIAAL
jgi:hypothetical protein